MSSPLTPRVFPGLSKLQLPGFYGFAMWLWGRVFFKPHSRWNVQQISLWYDKGRSAGECSVAISAPAVGWAGGEGSPTRGEADLNFAVQLASVTAPITFILCGKDIRSSS